MHSCDRCNNQLDDADLFCRACGTAAVTPIDLTTPQTITTVARQPRPSRNEVHHEPALKKVLVVAAVAVVGTLAIFATRPTSDGTPESAPSAADSGLANASDDPTQTITPDDAEGAAGTEGVDPEAFLGIAPDGTFDWNQASLESRNNRDKAERLVLITNPDEVTLLDFEEQSSTVWAAPEPLLEESPAAISGSVIVIGESRAWARSVYMTTSKWVDLGVADRVRISTKPDRVWIRRLNPKVHPTDAEYLWSEIDLTGAVHRTMFRDRELYFPTPELVSGIGGDLFRLTDLEVNPWRLFSPYGVIVAIGHNDVVTKECDREYVCERVWYDPATAEKRGSVYVDLAQNIEEAYGSLLSLDGRFVAYETDDGFTQVQAVASATHMVSNECLWDHPLAWSTNSELFVCTTSRGAELHNTDQRRAVALLSSIMDEYLPTFVFVPE